MRKIGDNLDPVAKVLAAVGVAAAAALARSPAALLGIAVVEVGAYHFAGYGWRQMVAAVKPFRWLVALTVVFGAATDLNAALMAGGRLLLMLGAAGWLVRGTSPEALVGAVMWLLTPLSRLGLPLAALGTAALLAIRLLPAVRQQAHYIQRAQEARGVGLRTGVRGRMGRLESLVVPLLAAVVRRADQLAEAMAVRGFRTDSSLMSKKKPRFAVAEVTVIAASFATLAFALWGVW